LSTTLAVGDLPSRTVVSETVPFPFSTRIVYVPSWLSLTVATGDLPSLMIVSVVVPSPFRTVIL